MTPIWPPPTRRPSDLDHGRLLLHLGAGHLVRRQDRHDLFHAFPRFQGLLGAVALFAEGGDDGSLGADDDVAAQAELLDPLDDVVDLLLRGARFHDDDHGVPFSERRWKANKKSPGTTGSRASVLASLWTKVTDTPREPIAG